MWPEVFQSKQVGSYLEPVTPPTTEPSDGPLVCVQFNKDWLPYVLGSLMQLVNPSSWLVADDVALELALERATALLDIFGQAGDCMTYALRFTDTCQLQFSVDGEETWTPVAGWVEQFATCFPPQTQLRLTDGCELQESFDAGSSWEVVPGWDENFGTCVQDNAPIIGLPPNPGDEEPDQFACSIAAYLANNVILNAMSAAVAAIQDDLTLLAFGANILNIIPEFILVRLGYDAVSIIYTAIAEGTLSDYEAAISDDLLWQAVTCCIYNAIVGDGYVTPGNFGAITTCIAAIPYAHSSVIDAIGEYLNSLGATGLAQLSQRAGLLVGADCSGCGSSTWCLKWQESGFLPMCEGEWVVDDDDPTEVGTCGSGVWTATFGFAGYWRIFLQCTLPSPRTITLLGIAPSGLAVGPTFAFYDHEGGTLLGTSTGPTLWTGSIAGVGFIRILSGQNSGSFTINTIQLAGEGSSPFGASNC